MKESSIGYKNYNYNLNKSIGENKKIKLEYPKYITTKELTSLQNKNENELHEININNLYLQQQSVFGTNSKMNSFQNYYNEIYSSKKGKNEDSKLKINSDNIIRNIFIKKLKNKRLNNPRKYLENNNKFFPSNLLDYIHPYEYLFNHKLKDNIHNNSNKTEKKLELHLSDINFIPKKKVKYFSRNQHINTMFSKINKTETNQRNMSIKKKKKIFQTENNYFKNNISGIKKSRNKKIFLTDSSIAKTNKRKRELFRNLSNITNKLNIIKKELKNEYQNQDKNNNKTDDQKLNQILSKFFSNNFNSKVTDEQTIKNLFKQIKKKYFFAELSRQYSSYNKKVFPLPIKKKFLQKLLKMDILEKKEKFLSSYRYNNDYEIKSEVNKLEENELSKNRSLFNKNTKKMKDLNIINIEFFQKTMKNIKIK